VENMFANGLQLAEGGALGVPSVKLPLMFI